MTLKFVIAVNPITKKNHGRIVTVHGRPMLLPSKQYVQYEKDCAPFIPRLKEPIDFPVNIQAHFYKDTRRACDLMNLYQSLADILVKYRVIADDNRNVLFSVDGSRVFWDKQFPRTEVVITSVPEEEFQSWKDG